MFQKIIRFSINHKLVIGIFTLMLAGFGILSLLKLPFDARPDITNNQVQVITQAPSLGAQEVEQFITTPVEMALANIPKVVEKRSISRSGLSVVTIVFEDGADIYWARQQISQQLKEAEEMIPDDIGTMSLGPVSTGLGEIYHYVIHPSAGYENQYSLADLRIMQDWIVRKQLSGTKGVAEVSGWGGFVKQYEIAVNTERLNAMGITILDLFKVLEENNENTGGSYIEQYSNQYFIRGVGIATSIEDLEKIAIKTINGTPLLIRDVAKVQLGSATRYGAVTRNGDGEVVAGITLMLKGENFQEVVANVKAKMAQIQKSLPEGVIIEPFIDRTDLVNRTMHTVEKNLIEGGLIVVFILVLFLGDFRAGLIVASVIPLSMLFAFSMMKLFGVSGNLMSLGAIDFGLIVDGAVIIVEAVCHRLTNAGTQYGVAQLSRKQMDTEVFEASSKIRNSAAFGEIIILIVYLPLFTLVGIEGKMFRPMAQTVFFAILGAFILSLTYIPMISTLFLSRKTIHKRNISDRIIEKLNSWYQPLLRRVLRGRRTLIISMVVLLVGSLLLFSRMGGEFMPNLEEGDFAAEISMSQGTSLSQVIKSFSQAEKIVKSQFPEVKQAVTRIGSAEIPTDPMPVERGDMMISLLPKKQWTSAKTTEELMEKMEHAMSEIPGVEVEMSQPMQMRFNELITGIKQDVAIKIYGNDLDVLTVYAKQIAQWIENVPGVTEPFVEQVTGLPQVLVTYNRDQLARYGVSVKEVNAILKTAFAGSKVGVLYEEDRRFDIMLRLDNELRNDIVNIENLYIPLSSGTTIPLSQMAEIKFKDAPAQISHEDGQRRIYVGFNVRGRDVERTIDEIQQLLNKKLQLPVGYYYTYGGQFQNLEEAKSRLSVAVPLALLLILILLYATLRNFKESLMVFSAIPLSLIGGILALWVRGMPFSISAGVGFIALFGVSVLNGIVLIAQYNQLEKEGVVDVTERILQGSSIRLRPVMITALVASLGFLPMALSRSDGAEVQRPLATVIIGGLITATLLTLFVLPSLYKIFNKEKKNKMKTVKTSSKMPIIMAIICLLLIPIKPQAQVMKSLDDCISYALEHNLTLQSGRIAIEKAKIVQTGAFNADKTQISLTQDPTSGGSPDNSIIVSQSFDFPSVYVTRYRVMKTETEMEKNRFDLSVNELKKEIAATYYNMIYVQENIRIRQIQDTFYQKFLSFASARYQSGETNRLEQINAERFYNDNRIALQQTEQEFKKLQLVMQQWLNSEELIIPEEHNLSIIEINEASLSGLNVLHSPQNRIFDNQLLWSKQNLALQQNAFAPTLNFAVRAQCLIKGFNPYNMVRDPIPNGNFTGFEVGISLPLFFGEQRANLITAKKEVAMAELSKKQSLLQLNKEYERYVSEYWQAKEVVAYYTRSANAQAHELAKLSQFSYQNGEIGYIEYMQNQQAVVEIYQQYAQAVNHYNQIAIMLNFLQGDNTSSK